MFTENSQITLKDKISLGQFGWWVWCLVESENACQKHSGVFLIDLNMLFDSGMLAAEEVAQRTGRSRFQCG